MWSLTWPTNYTKTVKPGCKVAIKLHVVYRINDIWGYIRFVSWLMMMMRLRNHYFIEMEDVMLPHILLIITDDHYNIVIPSVKIWKWLDSVNLFVYIKTNHIKSDNSFLSCNNKLNFYGYHIFELLFWLIEYSSLPLWLSLGKMVITSETSDLILHFVITSNLEILCLARPKLLVSEEDRRRLNNRTARMAEPNPRGFGQLCMPLLVIYRFSETKH